ncbi:MAG TPA: hypothetical protein VF669_02140 [Tepidisphaeraceae bacterium]|jgi:hypothetical protein
MEQQPTPPPARLAYSSEPQPSLWRTRLATAAAIGGGIAAGFMINPIEGNYLIPWFYLSFLGPFILCCLATSRKLILALLFSGIMMFGPLLRLLLPSNGIDPIERENALIVVSVLSSISLGIAASIAFSPMLSPQTITTVTCDEEPAPPHSAVAATPASPSRSRKLNDDRR